MLVDASESCMISGRPIGGVLVHACQTDSGASGGPLLVNSQHPMVLILGVQAGGFTRGVQDKAVWTDAGVDTRLVPNVGNAITGRVAVRLQELAGGQ
jgi:hypothetical protein